MMYSPKSLPYNISKKDAILFYNREINIIKKQIKKSINIIEIKNLNECLGICLKYVEEIKKSNNEVIKKYEI